MTPRLPGICSSVPSIVLQSVALWALVKNYQANLGLLNYCFGERTEKGILKDGLHVLVRPACELPNSFLG